MHALLYIYFGFYARMKGKEGHKTPEPEFKNPRVGALFHKWRHVWLMAMERRRKLQDGLDKLNEVRYFMSVILFSGQTF